MNRLIAVILAGLLAIPGLSWFGDRAYAQSSQMTETERQELEKKYQEQWDFLEKLDKRMENTGQRLEDAVKRREDAEKRQREAERRLRQSERQRSGGQAE